MPAFNHREKRGQAMVEFALIIGVLLMIIFVVIESGLLLQANLTVQNAARAGGRYAITGQFETDCLTEDPPCADPRVDSIRSVAEEALSGLSLDPDAGFEEAGYYLIEVFGTDAEGNLVENSAGMPGRPIIVRVSYRAAVLTPLLRPIAETVMVTGQTVMNNERVVQVGTAGEAEAPPVPVPPPIEPTPAPPPDLVLTKSGPSSVVEGAQFNYTLSLANNGQQGATNVELTDPQPGGITFISVSPSGTCENNSSTISCDWPSLAVGEPQNIVITAQANVGTSGNTITNTATVTLDEADASPADNTAHTVLNVVPDTTETDLEITKTGPESGPVSTAEEEFTVDYQITVRNNGPNEATGVVVTDTLPADMEFRSGGSSSECAGGTPVTCSLGTLANGESTTLTIQARTPFSEGSPANAATVDSEDIEDLDASNNSDSHVTNFVFIADLEITKSASPSTLNAGEVLTYTINVWNSADSPHTATGVSISDPLPNFVTLQGATYTAPDGDGNCSVSGNVVTCVVGTLAPGVGASATIVIIPQRPGTLINSAQVAGEQNDPDTINNATAVTSVDAESDLSILKTVEPDPVFAGDLITYTLTVTNAGPSRATGVTVRDDLPDQVVFQNVQSNYGSCSWDSGLRRVTCSLGTVPAGTEITIKITVIPIVPDDESDESWPIENTASVQGNEPDPVDNNNSDLTTTVFPGNPFIVLNPSCGPAETPVTIEGYRWSGNRSVSVSWLDEQGATVHSETVAKNSINNQTGRFTLSATAPAGVLKEIFEVQAVQEAQGNTDPAEDIQLFNLPCSNPDLEVMSLAGDLDEVEQYEPVTYTVTITNSGDEAANNSFYVSLYAFEQPVSSTTTHLTATNRLDVNALSGLAVGASMELTFYAQDGFPNTGTYYIYAVVDSDPGPSGRIEEMYETNNLAEQTIDVVASSADPPPDPPEGDQQLSGETYIFVDSDEATFALQSMVKVSAYDADSGDWLATTYSDLVNAEYRFTSLPAADDYHVEASITVDGVYYSFAGTVTPPLQTLILYPE